MTRVVIGGVVRRNNQPHSHVAPVEKIEFSRISPAVIIVPNGAEGTMYLKNTPPAIGHYDRDDILLYEDKNTNNNAILRVRRNIGPTKYIVERTA